MTPTVTINSGKTIHPGLYRTDANNWEGFSTWYDGDDICAPYRGTRGLHEQHYLPIWFRSLML